MTKTVKSSDRLEGFMSSYVDSYANFLTNEHLSGLPYGPLSTEFYSFKTDGEIHLQTGHKYFIDISHNGPNDGSYINVDIFIDDIMVDILDNLKAELSALNDILEQDSTYLNNHTLTTVLSTNLDERRFMTTVDAVIAVQSGCNFTFDVSDKYILPISSQVTNDIVNTENAIYSKNLEIDKFSFSESNSINPTMAPPNSYISFHFENWRDIKTTFAYFKVTPFNNVPEYGVGDLLTGKPGMKYMAPYNVTFATLAPGMRHLTGGVDSIVSY